MKEINSSNASHQLAPQILVVDDEPHVRKTLTIILERAGYSVNSVTDGDEAIVMLSSPATIWCFVTCACHALTACRYYALSRSLNPTRP